MSDDDARVPDAWIEFVASVIYDAREAGILEKLDEISDDEIDAALDKARDRRYNRSVMQAPRVISEKPTSYAGLVSAPQKA